MCASTINAGNMHGILENQLFEETQRKTNWCEATKTVLKRVETTIKESSDSGDQIVLCVFHSLLPSCDSRPFHAAW